MIAATALTVPATASAITLTDIMALSRAGVADVVLTALIDADRTIFTLGPEQILELRDAGVSDAVVLKMLGSRRQFEPARPQAVETGEPPTLVETATLPIVTTLTVPFYVPVPILVDGRGPERARDRHRGHADRTEHDRRTRTPFPAGTIRNGEFVKEP